jgi:hypothetical protein
MGQMLVSFEMNARSMFTLVCNRITTQIKHDADFFHMLVQCVAHRIDLDMIFDKI